MATNKLIDIVLKQSEPTAKDYWLADGAGLRLLIKPSGAKLWRFNYRFNGKQKTLALGQYPNASLKEARKRHGEAKVQLGNSIDPAQQKQRQKQLERFKDTELFVKIAKEWWEHQKGTWTQEHFNAYWSA